MENKAEYQSVEVIGENNFHDTVLESLNDSSKRIIYTIKESLLNEFLNNVEDKGKGDFVRVELNNAQTSTGSTKLLEFYIEDIETDERENIVFKKFEVSI